jgi:threonine dehydrogenase-like Zn-dependent dehydrogenase
LGADVTFDASAEDFVPQVLDHTHGDGVHVVIEASGNIQSLRDAMNLARPLARVVILGVFDQPWVQETSPLVANEYTILPSVGSPGVWPLTISLMEQGRIQAGPIISGKFPMSEYQEAFEVVSRGGPTILKCLLLPGREGLV